jgi:competence protein ComEA
MLRTVLSVVALIVGFAGHPLAQAQPAQKPEASAARPAAVVNLNTATAAELEQLPGVGAKTAARIVEYRQKKGPFKKIEELMNVQGIGEKSFLRIRAQITVGNQPPAGQQ